MIALNLGSGQRPFKSPWTNVDLQEKYNPDVVMDATDYLRTFTTPYVDMICLHHQLEHVGCGEADALLRECHRALRPGGSLLVFVPDMSELAMRWREGRIDTQTYMINVYGAYMGDEADRHKFGYTYTSLRGLLQSVGFKCSRFDGRQIAGSDIAQSWWILGMEGIK
jgi:predicted SAM-dependent methyltransferase